MQQNERISSCAIYHDRSYIGKKYNMLTVLDVVHIQKNFGKVWFWKAQCDCGNIVIISPSKVIRGRQKSCGCLRHRSAANRTHGESHTRLHNIWCGMNDRCNPNNADSQRYGKRGIKICDEWKSYENFADWARGNGYDKNLTIERIDVNGDYCPQNCKWITLAKQARNRRTTSWVEYNGRVMSLAEACEIANIPYKQVWYRIHRCGWSFEKSITTPIGADIGQKESKHTCMICGREFVSHSCRSKYCSIECYRVYKNACRRNDRTILDQLIG